METHSSGDSFPVNRLVRKINELWRRALAIREKVYGPNRIFTAEITEGLAKVCEQTGRAAEAQELSVRAQRIREHTQATTDKPQP